MESSSAAERDAPNRAEARWRRIRQCLPVGGGALVLGAFYLASLYSYLLFHSLAELFSIIVACGIFVVAWNSRAFWRNGFFLFLGVAYLFVGGMDLVHALAYKGMGVFPGAKTNLATQLWVAARYMESLSLLAATLFLRRRMRAKVALSAYLGVFVLLLCSIFAWKIFPVCFAEGTGLTAFKRVSEYVICALFAAAAVVLWRNRAAFVPAVLRLTIASLVLSIFSELTFTLYASAFDAFNLIGHLLKIVSFYLIYRAVIQTALVKPYDLLFLDLTRAQEALRQARDDLEDRVQRRTADLARTVAKLREEVRERAEAEEALRKSEARLAEAQRIAVIGNWDWDIVADELWWSDEIYRIFGLRPQEFGATYGAFLARVHPDDVATVRRAVDDALYRDRPYGIDHRVVQPDGTVLVVHEQAEVFRDGSGRPVRMSGTVQDITERKRAEQAVENERRRLYAVMQMLPGYVCLLGSDHSIRFANDRFLDLFGPPDGRACHEVLRARSDPCDPCRGLEPLRTNRPCEWEWVSPTERVFQSSAYPFTDIDGTPLSLALGTDVTERKQLEEEILRISEDERRRVGQDLHDSLGQILSGVSCLSHVLHRKLSARSADEAEEAAKVEALIGESLQLARSLSHGLSPVGMEPDSLMAAVKELADDTESMFDIRCRFECAEPVLVSDGIVATHLYRIAQEAISNAVRHGKAKEICISLAARDGTAELRVDDDGVGLPDDAAQREGMGLRIMHYRADLIGAEIDVRRRGRRGTTVTCRLGDDRHRGNHHGR